MSFVIDYSEDRFQIGKNTLILGQNSTGKTGIVLTNIFLKFQSKISYLFVVSRDEKYKEITSHVFEEKHLSKIFQEIQCLNRIENKLLIIDEITQHSNPILECILINSHHFNITVIMVSKIGELNLIMRDYTDIVVIGKEKSITILRNFYEKYMTIMDDFTYFVDVISGLGKNEFVLRSKNNVSLIRVNEHWYKYLYSYKMFVNYDLLMKINEKKKEDVLLNRVNMMMDELLEIKKKLELK